MVYFDSRRTDDLELVLYHKIIDLVYRACGAVFDGNNAVLAHTCFDSGKNRLKGIKKDDTGILENLFAGRLRVSALNSLTSNDRVGREYFFCVFQSI